MAYKASKSPVLGLWKRIGGSEFGRWLVSRIVCLKAPYFSTIKPRFTMIEPGRVELAFKKRRAVQNHLKSVHAIAMCNAAELVGGICLDVSLHRELRWIPVGMEVKYLKIARTDLTAVCRVGEFDWETPQDVVMPVGLFDRNGDEVFHADITMRLSSRK